MFFQDLRWFLNNYPAECLIIGGDFNTTFSLVDTADNIDTLFMNRPPGHNRSVWLNELCNDFNLSDPYRVMHPHKREYTYVPRNGGRNRSRLDFFIVSDNLITLIEECSIQEHLASDLLDHKLINLSFSGAKDNNKASILPETINNPLLGAVVWSTILDIYSIHALRMNDNVQLDEIRNFSVQISVRIREINEVYGEIVLNNNLFQRNHPMHDLYRNRIVELLDVIENGPGPEIIRSFVLEPEYDIFFETLIGVIRNNVLSFQSHIKKLTRAKKSNIENNLRILKLEYEINHEEIFELEDELRRMSDEELKAKIDSMKIFEGLNSEKPSPHFLKLVKKSSGVSLKQIRKDTGEEFPNEEDRMNYIVKYYEQLYKCNPNEPENFLHAINNFLGPEILGSNLVQNSKLSLDEQNSLETELSIAELDEAVEQGNSKSAPGMDGFSMKFIKKIWKYLRIPMHEYVKFCFDKGSLSFTFKIACIRLIPKKTDNSKLKNWRPISLLSNLYKILSRAINNRMKKVGGRICSRSQKGFVKNRYTQEVILNVWDTIAYCNKNNIKSCVIAVDMAKAFDSLSHKYMEAVYEFFGFGPNMRKWLKIIGQGRSACLLDDNGNYSKNFPLGRGNAQGDVPSPMSFNFGDQILLFKIELDPGITGIERIHRNRAIRLDENNLALNGHYNLESGRQTSKNESLADDNTTITLMTPKNIINLKNILDEFKTFSGLECNYDKTMVLPVGEIDDETNRAILDAGFLLSEKITLLGFQINASLSTDEEMFSKILEKVTKLVNFWSRFRLSLPGRCTIAKTYMLSQLNYIGCVVKPPDLILDRIQSSIDSFIAGAMRISKDRLYLPEKKGGLGWFDLKEFLRAQNCAWLFRAAKGCIDNWRYDLYTASPMNNPLLVRKTDIDRREAPLLYRICENFEKLLCEFTKSKNTFSESYLLYNEAITDGQSCVNDNFFQGRNVEARRCLKVSDFFEGNRFKSRADLEDNDIMITPANWFRLQLMLVSAKTKYAKYERFSGCESISELLHKYRKGSKIFRNILSFVRIKDFDVKNLACVTTYSRLIDVRLDKVGIIENLLNSWKHHYLTNDIREFLFKTYNNKLELNNRLHAINAAISPVCTFCRIANRGQRDSYNHFFFTCQTTLSILNQFNTALRGMPAIDSNEFKKVYWLGVDEHDDFNSTTLIFFSLFRYNLWKFRQRNALPNYTMFVTRFNFILRTTLAKSGWLRAEVGNNGMLQHFIQALDTALLDVSSEDDITVEDTVNAQRLLEEEEEDEEEQIVMVEAVSEEETHHSSATAVPPVSNTDKPNPMPQGSCNNNNINSAMPAGNRQEREDPGVPVGDPIPKGQSAMPSGNTATGNNSAPEWQDDDASGFKRHRYELIRRERDRELRPVRLGAPVQHTDIGSGSFLNWPQQVPGMRYFHLYEYRNNASHSFVIQTMTCEGCRSGPHPIYDGSGPKVIVAGDQHCVPSLCGDGPEAGYTCPAVVRIEDPTVEDLIRMIGAIIKSKMPPEGTVVVVSAVSMLARNGLQQYLVDMGMLALDIRNSTNGKLKMLLGLPAAAVALTDPVLIRDINDLLDWMKATDINSAVHDEEFSCYFRDNFMLTMNVDNTNSIATLNRQLRLVDGLGSNSRKQYSFGGHPNLAADLMPMRGGMLDAYVVMLADGLANHAVKIDREPGKVKVVREEEISVVADGPKVVVAGASHAARLSAMLRDRGVNVTDLSIPGWILTERTGMDMAEDIANAKQPDTAAIILWLHDNAVYKATTEDGRRTNPVRGRTGYHITGKLQMIPAQEVVELNYQCLPAIRASGRVPVFIIGPLPRYLESKCCSDPLHITNFDLTSYGNDMRQHVDTITRSIKSLLHSRRLDTVKVIRPLAHMEGAGERVWGADPVHPVANAYGRLAVHIIERVKEVARETNRKRTRAIQDSGESSRHSSSREGHTGSVRERLGHRGSVRYQRSEYRRNY